MQYLDLRAFPNIAGVQIKLSKYTETIYYWHERRLSYKNSQKLDMLSDKLYLLGPCFQQVL